MARNNKRLGKVHFWLIQPAPKRHRRNGIACAYIACSDIFLVAIVTLQLINMRQGSFNFSVQRLSPVSRRCYAVNRTLTFENKYSVNLKFNGGAWGSRCRSAAWSQGAGHRLTMHSRRLASRPRIHGAGRFRPHPRNCPRYD